jgi:hypothetical protein
MGKSLVGVGNQQLGIKYSSVTIFIWCVEDWFEKNLVSFNDSCVFFLVIYLFRVTIGYKGKSGCEQRKRLLFRSYKGRVEHKLQGGKGNLHGRRPYPYFMLVILSRW